VETRAAIDFIASAAISTTPTYGSPRRVLEAACGAERRRRIRRGLACTGRARAGLRSPW